MNSTLRGSLPSQALANNKRKSTELASNEHHYQAKRPSPTNVKQHGASVAPFRSPSREVSNKNAFEAVLQEAAVRASDVEADVTSLPQQHQQHHQSHQNQPHQAHQNQPHQSHQNQPHRQRSRSLQRDHRSPSPNRSASPQQRSPSPAQRPQSPLNQWSQSQQHQRQHAPHQIAQHHVQQRPQSPSLQHHAHQRRSPSPVQHRSASPAPVPARFQSHPRSQSPQQQRPQSPSNVQRPIAQIRPQSPTQQRPQSPQQQRQANIHKQQSQFKPTARHHLQQSQDIDRSQQQWASQHHQPAPQAGKVTHNQAQAKWNLQQKQQSCNNGGCNGGSC